MKKIKVHPRRFSNKKQKNIIKQFMILILGLTIVQPTIIYTQSESSVSTETTESATSSESVTSSEQQDERQADETMSQLQPEIDLNIDELDDIREVNLVDDLGAVPNDGKDDSKAFQEALNLATKEPIRLVIPEGEYLSQGEGNLEASGIKGLQIRGDNAVIKPENPMINPSEYYFMKLFMAEDNVGVEIEGITIDGSLNPQDLYFTMESSEDIYDLQLQRGIYIENAQRVSVSNTAFRHMYGGYALHLSKYELVNIQNVKLDDVGGDDITDSFGMAFYLGGHEGDAVVNIDNVKANGKVSERDPSYTAWIGVVVENGSIQSDKQEDWLLDKNTTVNVTNSTFMDYETTFHVESMAGNVYFNADNVMSRAKNYFIAAGINGEMKSMSQRINFEMTPWGRNGIITGLYYSENEEEKNLNGLNEFIMENSRVRYQNLENVPLIPVATSYGDSIIAYYNNVTFQEVPSKLVTNASGIFTDSQINLYIESSEDAESLQEGPFSNSANQRVEFLGSTSVNEAGNHAQAQPHNNEVSWFEPTGYQSPSLDGPLEAPINNLD
ncbi:hypothetical protein ACF3NG_01625 [Aerococcaceae bacterium WGS1372]